MADVGGETKHTEARDACRPLPGGWCWTTLGEVVPKPDVKLQPDPASKLMFIGMDHVEEAGFRLLGHGMFAEMKSAASHFRAGDILYGRLRPYLNKVHLARFEGAASAEFIVLRPFSEISSDYLKYLLHRQHFVNFAMERVSGDRPRTNYQAISEYPLPLPPAAEQARIAEKIDALFAQIEAGETALAAARRNVTRYRKAVLKAAVTGALTADWRAENPNKVGDGEALLTRLLAERRAAWERDQIEKAKAKGKPLKGDAWKAKYKPPVEPETESLPELPEGWVWASVDEISSDTLIGLVRSRHEQRESGGDAFYVKMDSISQDGTFQDLPLASIDASKDELQRYSLRRGDILFNTRNSAELVGKTGMYPGGAEPTVFNNNLMRIRLVRSAAPSFIWTSMRAGSFKKHIDSRKRATTNIAAVYGKDLLPAPIALPSPAEQAEIVARVDAALEEADRIDAQLYAQERASKGLRQSVLKAAFEGSLVPQDPNDEPASKLLERIRAERAKAGKTGARRRKVTS